MGGIAILQSSRDARLLRIRDGPFRQLRFLVWAGGDIADEFVVAKGRKLPTFWIDM